MTDNTKLDGATTAPDPWVEAVTAGEFAARWNQHTEEDREQAWNRFRDAMRRADTCFVTDHEGRIEWLEKQRDALAAVIEQAKSAPYHEVIAGGRRTDSVYTILHSAGTDAALREVRATNRAAVIQALIDCYYAGDKNTFALPEWTPDWLRAVLRTLDEEANRG